MTVVRQHADRFWKSIILNLGLQDLHLAFHKVLDRAEFFNMLHKVDEEFGCPNLYHQFECLKSVWGYLNIALQRFFSPHVVDVLLQEAPTSAILLGPFTADKKTSRGWCRSGWQDLLPRICPMDLSGTPRICSCCGNIQHRFDHDSSIFLSTDNLRSTICRCLYVYDIV